MPKKRKHSLKTHLCLWILGMSVVIFGAIYGACVYFAAKEVKRSVHATVDSKLDYALYALDAGLSSVEISANNFIAAHSIKYNGVQLDEEFAFIEHFLDINPHVIGIAVGYEPKTVGDKGSAPYVMRGENGYSRLNLAELKDYRSDEWYSITMQQGKSHWAKPFMESNGKNIIMPYCVPMKDAEGHIIGVVALDINLSDMGTSLQSIKPFPNALLTAVDEDGVFVAHPNREYILKESIASLIRKSGHEPNPEILADIKAGRRNWGEYNIGEGVHYLFYAKSNKVDWTITLDVTRSDIAEGLDDMFRTMTVDMIIGIIVLLTVCIVAISRITRPLNKFADAASKISGGDFHAEIPEVEYSDLHHLQDALVSMEDSLDKYVTELKSTTEAKASIEGELKIARNIQMAMVPKIFPPYPERHELDVFATLVPAKAVGGDLYDFFLEGDDLLFCIGDVSGKGVPGSLFMAITRSLFRNIGKHTKSPAAIASALNNAIAENNEENMFVTMFIGRCNLKTGDFACCNCGHNPPATNGDVTDLKTMTVTPGPNAHFLVHAPTNIPIGVVPGFLYQEVRMRVTPGVKMFLFTDGVTEAENHRKELYGDERFLSTIYQYHGDVSAQKSVEGILDSVISFTEGAEQSDDITMLCFRYMGPEDEYAETPADQKQYSLTIDNKVEDMARLAPFLEDVAAAYGLANDVAFQLNLALDEAVANSVNYAYPPGVEGPVVINTEKKDDSVIFTMIDGGVPFDPTQGGDVDTSLSVEDRPIGGLGIFLIKQMMDSISYQRSDNKNILTMIKKINN